MEDRQWEPLTVTVRHHERSLIVQVAGEVDLLTAPRMSRALDHATSTCPRLVVVDLSKVKFLSGAGLSVLEAAHRRAEGRTCLRVVATGRVTLRPLRITNLDQYLALYESVDAALSEPLGTGRP
jgi:anti-anti-sigma factor